MENKTDTKPDFPKMEEEILRFWEKEKIFEKSLEKTKNGQPFVFFEGPPTANGRPGIHHVLARAYKDIICRYKTLRGYFVERKAGWDTHGLPVELQVEKELKISGKPQIEKYGVEKFNQKCKEDVWKYKTEWEEMTERIGFWLDLEHPYITYENYYIESLWWIIKQVWDKGLLYQGHKVVPHCPRCGTALSSHEVAQGYEKIKEESIYVKFKARGASHVARRADKRQATSDKPTYILSWTTTPWTLPGNVALAIGENIDYIEVEQNDERYILAKAALGHLDGKYKIVKEYKGEDLVGLEYEPLFDIPSLKSKTAYKVYAADFVSTEEGTGVVHTAVMYGEDDYNLGEKVGLPKHHTVDESGRFTKEVKKWQGKFVKDVEEDITQDLRDRGLLYKTEMYEHDYPFCWRCETPLLYYAKNSWFIKMSGLREQLIKNNKNINWVPAYIKEGRFGEWLLEVKDWAFSRERYWGTPLPIWVCEKCGNKECVGSIDELVARGASHVATHGDKQQATSNKLDLHRPYVDKIKLKCSCGGAMKRVLEVVDAWFDSGSMPFAQWHYPFENKERIDGSKSFPADYISEAIDQTRGWFYTLLAVSTLLEKGAPYKNVVCLGLVTDSAGQKMSKSKGNIIFPKDVIDQFGADAVRWYLFTMNQPGESKNFDIKGVEEVVKKNFLIFWNIFSFYKMYASSKKLGATQPKHILDQWVTAKLNLLIDSVTKKLDKYQITDAAREISGFINELSTWYLRRSRSRFKKEGEDKSQALAILHHCLLELSRLLAPFTPFLADHLYRELVKENQSVHLEDWPTPNKRAINKSLIDKMVVVKKVVELGHALRKEKNIKVRQPLSQFIIQYQYLDDELLDLIKDELNVGEVILTERLPTGDEFVRKEDSSIKVCLDITITDELKIQGIVREIIRQINAMRKDANLTIGDLVTLYYHTDDPVLKTIFEQNKSQILTEVIATSAEEKIPQEIELKKVLDFGGKKVTFTIKKNK